MSASDAQSSSMTDSEALPRQYEAGPSAPRSRHSRHPTASDLGSMSEVEGARQVSRTPRSGSRRMLSVDERDEREKVKGKGREVTL